MRLGLLAALAMVALIATAALTQPSFNDYRNMLDQLGIKAVRPGPNPNDPATYDEANANRYKDSMPDVLRMNDGAKVKLPSQWPKRRAEIVRLFEEEVYGRIPKRVPRVTWEVTSVEAGSSGGIPTLTKVLVGRVDNRACPSISVNIQARFTVPAHATRRVPIMIEFGGFGPPRNGIPWTQQAIQRGWGYGSINPASIQPDNNRLTTGIIGLTNRGNPRKPDDWGALRAWQWGLSRLIDYFESSKDSMVDPRGVGIEGVSRFGKAALVSEAFDTRVAVAFVASSGEGGAKLHRHVFGEAVENLAGGEYYWMAGNFIKYGASEPKKTAADLPVDSHELIALCAPRPCFISYGAVEHGDPNWVDARGSFMAAVLAGPVYRLLGKRDLGTPGDYLTDPMPPIEHLIGGELAWRQHNGGHDATPNWPSFFDWVGRFIQAAPVPADTRPAVVKPDQPSPRLDANSRLAHSQMLEKARNGRIDLYFVGDSITRRWGTSDAQYRDFLENWKQNFFGWNAADFGWGGDTTQNILWRLRNGELDGVEPKVIVVLAGTNNLVGPGRAEPEEIAKGIAAIVATCREKAPKATVILTAVFPRNDHRETIPLIERINKEIARSADGRKVRFLNVNDRLADGNGKLFPGMMNDDGLHPALPCYRIWADGLKPILTELMGPPAKSDQAPPPTGDPSAGG
jgi:lysophospholipase L1-like esterase